MIETRNLTKEEFERLMNEAAESETRFIKESGMDAYEFFNSGNLIQGLIIDGRPIYIAMVRKGESGNYIFWTVVNSNVSREDKITLSKLSKKELDAWKFVFKAIYATMTKENPIHMRWVERLGFVKIDEDETYVTYRLGD